MKEIAKIQLKYLVPLILATATVVIPLILGVFTLWTIFIGEMHGRIDNEKRKAELYEKDEAD